MKYNMYMFALFISLSAKSQYNETPKMLPLSDAVVKDQAQSLINSFKNAVVRSVRCKQKNNYSVESTLQKFTYDAKIEISRLRDTRINAVSPRVYFATLRDLCLGINYDSIDIQFLPELIESLEISRFNNTCIIKRDIKQQFTGFKNGKPVYCDITIKEIKIDFIPQADGTYKGLISYIAVKGTEKCIPNK